MTIHWHKRAAAQLHQVEDYVLRDFGERIRQEFMDEVEQAVLALADMPTIGKLDPLFAHRRQAYRSIIVRRLNKVVYYVKGDTLHIAAFWDTRREPIKQREHTIARNESAESRERSTEGQPKNQAKQTE